jgi:NAD(P)-dependent dehydrogenase (short-subunit alcohol dehydrogenase family)
VSQGSVGEEAGGRVRTRAVLVTGASSGIGAASARWLAARGWEVYASVRRAGEAPEGTTELRFDVTDAVAVGHAATGVEELDGIVANAGVAIAAPLEALPPDELTRQLDVNVVGQLRTLQAFLPALRRRHGRVVLMGSIAGRSALPFLGAYAMSKFALEAMADALRVELAPEGIHVAIVQPGTIATPIWTKPQRNAEDLPPELLERYGPRIAAFREKAAARSAKGVAADEVAKVVERALTAERPRTRYLVGPDAKRRARLQALPDRARDRLLQRFLFGS